MSEGPELITQRLVLRRWREADRAPFAALNADRVVREFFPTTLTRPASDLMVDQIEDTFERHGCGLWAVERRDTAEFTGFVGLSPAGLAGLLPDDMWEIGWRLARAHWGQGFATEAATAAVDDAFGRLAMTEIVSFTAVGNVRSRAVMERLGLRRDPTEDFDHPSVPDGHDLKRHVLYRITAAQWAQRN